MTKLIEKLAFATRIRNTYRALIMGFVFAVLAPCLAQSEPAAVSCDAASGRLVIEPGSSAPVPGGTLLRVQYYFWKWDGASWQGQGWSETFDYDAQQDITMPVEFQVEAGYYRITSRYQWVSDVQPTTPHDVETDVYLQLTPADTSRSPHQVPSDQLAPQVAEGSYCHLY